MTWDWREGAMVSQRANGLTFKEARRARVAARIHGRASPQ